MTGRFSAERRRPEVLVHGVEAGEHLAEGLPPDGHHQREADGRVVGVATADPVPELEHVVGVDAERGHALGVGGHRHEVLGHGVVARRVAQPGQQPVTGGGGVGQRLEGGERLGADDEECRLRVEVVRGGVEVDRVDVRHEAAGQPRLGVVGQGQGGHGRAQVRAADADVDDRGDPLARGPGPGPVADAVGEVPHLAQHRLHVADDVLPVDVQDRLPGGMRSATCSTARSSVVLMCVAGEHGVAVLLRPRPPGQVHEEPQGLVGHPLLRVVEHEVGRSRRHARRPLGVVGEEVAQVPRRDLRRSAPPAPSTPVSP